jgi:DNA-binding transcriptional LysR family regulator
VLLRRFRAEHPSVILEMVEGSAREAMAHLHERRIDVAFLVGTFGLPDCHPRRVWTERLVVAITEGHKLAEQSGVTWADLAGETFFVRHGGTGPQVHDQIVLRLANAEHPAFRGETWDAAFHGSAGIRCHASWGGEPVIPDSRSYPAADQG